MHRYNDFHTSLSNVEIIFQTVINMFLSDARGENQIVLEFYWDTDSEYNWFKFGRVTWYRSVPVYTRGVKPVWDCE